MGETLGRKAIAKAKAAWQWANKRRLRMIAVVMVVFHVLGFISSIHAVMSTRTSQGAIAWAISLNTFPYIAVPAYWVLGRSRFQGYVVARKEGDDAVAGIAREAASILAPYRMPASEMRYPEAGKAAEGLTGIPYLKGNSVKLLIDGEATFGDILAGIDAAQEYILFQFFIVHDDELGREVKSHLIAKANEGVRIYFLYDEVGSHDLPNRYKDELREAGVQVHDFHTRKGTGNRFQINFRNHRKLVVVDGRRAWIGGLNVGDEYMGKDPKFGHWRDTHMMIEGPAVLAAQFAFTEDWKWAAGTLPEVDWTPKPSADGNASVLVLPTGPADELESAALMFMQAINTATERIWIASPYFVPDEALIAALQLAGLKGVDVRILIPDKPDHYLVYLAAYSYFDEASATGVQFYRYLDGFLHEKVMLIDDHVATVGTANFDNRSFRLNFEITAVVVDSAFASDVEQMFNDDFAKSRKMEPGEYDEKSFLFRLGVKLARLTAPVQ